MTRQRPDIQGTDAEDYLLTDPMALTELEALWVDLAGPGRVPRRSDLDPAALGPLIEDAMILERVAPGVARIRVAGQRITALIGTEPRGMPLSAIFLPAARAHVTRALEQCFRGPCVVELPLVSPGGFLQSRLQGRMILLPLQDGFGRVTRCLGAIVASGRRGTGARRFDIDPTGSSRQDPVRGLQLLRGGMTDQGMKKAETPPDLRLVVDNA